MSVYIPFILKLILELFLSLLKLYSEYIYTTPKQKQKRPAPDSTGASRLFCVVQTLPTRASSAIFLRAGKSRESESRAKVESCFRVGKLRKSSKLRKLQSRELLSLLQKSKKSGKLLTHQSRKLQSRVKVESCQSRASISFVYRLHCSQSRSSCSV